MVVAINPEHKVKLRNQIFFFIFLLGQIVILIFFSQWANYDRMTTNLNDQHSYINNKFEELYVVDNQGEKFLPEDFKYNFWIDYLTIVIIGLAILLTILHQYSFNGIIYTFWLVCFSIQWGFLVIHFVGNVFEDNLEEIELTYHTIHNATVCGIVTGVTWAALIGKVNLIEMTIIAFFEIIVFAIHHDVIRSDKALNLIDHGALHYIFISTFAMTTSFWVSRQTKTLQPSVLKNQFGNSFTHIFSAIGTGFLWVFFPSKNAGRWDEPGQINRSAINTILVVAATTTSAFYFSKIINSGRVHVYDFQVSSLTGLVALTSSSGLWTQTWVPLLIGFGMGAYSVCAHKWIHPINNRNGLDTGGVFILNFGPGIIGGCLTAIAVACNYDMVLLKKADRTNHEQAGMQLVGILTAFGFAIVGGTLTGLLVKYLGLIFNKQQAVVDAVDFEHESFQQVYAEDIKFESKEAAH